MSVFEDPVLGGLFADPEVAALIAARRTVSRMIGIEAAYALALGRGGVVVSSVSGRAAKAIAAVRPDMAQLRSGAALDGLAVPSLVEQIKTEVPEALHIAVHRGLTSQDVIDTALVLALRDVLAIYETRIAALDTALSDLAKARGVQALMGRTRMQAAVEITAGDRIQSWSQPWADHAARLSALKPRLLRLQFGGAAGTRAALGEHAVPVAEALAAALELENPPKAWHAMRDGLGEFASWLSLTTGTLGKIGQDISLMAQQGLDEIRIGGTGGSSAMAHKRNPIKAELLTTLARFNAAQLGGFHQALIHEQERSGAAWALEWMILPQMMQATGRALTVGTELIRSIEAIGASAGGH